jgi:acetyl-CoA C-acetyltransferase/acetyl-CoA acyltransferase
MRKLRKKVYFGAGYNTMYFGSGRPEFHPGKPMPTFEAYLKETAAGTLAQLAAGAESAFDEGVVANFMAGRFLKQGNLPGFLPMAVPGLEGKPCTRVEGACGSGGLALVAAVKSVLSDMADAVFVAGFEVQNTLKAVYGADVLAAAGYVNGHRKEGHAYFFPGVFSDRAGAYYERYGTDTARRGMAKWYELAILNARRNPKAQEHHNAAQDPFALGMTPPDGRRFVHHLNLFDCSKVSDGASSLVVADEEGLARLGLRKEDCVELAGFHGSEGDITEKPAEPTVLENTGRAARGALEMAGISKEEVGFLELHDCFSITGLLALESIGFAPAGGAPAFVLDGHCAPEGSIPTNLSGGLCGFGHPVGATGVRQMVDLVEQLTAKAPNPARGAGARDHGMMVSMGGNDKTVTSLVVRRAA